MSIYADFNAKARDYALKIAEDFTPYAGAINLAARGYTHPRNDSHSDYARGQLSIISLLTAAYLDIMDQPVMTRQVVDLIIAEWRTWHVRNPNG